MNLRDLTDGTDYIDWSMLGTNVDPSIPPIQPGTVMNPNAPVQLGVNTPGVSSGMGWLAQLFQPAASVANTYLTQQGLTTRQNNLIAAGQAPGVPGASLLQVNAAGQSTLFGIPVLYLAVGAGVFLMVKK